MLLSANLDGDVLSGMIMDITELKKAEEEIEKFKFISDNAIDAQFLVGRDARFLYVNKIACRMFNYSEKEFLTLRVPDVDAIYDLAKFQELFDSLQKEQLPPIETINIRKDRSVFPAEIAVTGYQMDGKPYMFAALRDITIRKKAEEILQKAYNESEMRVRVQTSRLSKTNKKLLAEINEHKKTEKRLLKAEEDLTNHVSDLKEINTALNVLLKQRESDKQELEQNILSNVKRLIMPYLGKIRKLGPKSKELTYLNILESNINEIISPFTQKMSSKFLGFTPKEIEIADLIKDGQHDKDIAEILNIALETVKSHRQNIRKKLGLYSKRTNLRTHLLYLSK